MEGVIHVVDDPGLNLDLPRNGKYRALKLAGELAHYIKNEGQVLASDGTFLAGHEHDWTVVHWHHSFLSGVACAEYGASSGDAEILDFANTAYLHALTLGSRDEDSPPNTATASIHANRRSTTPRLAARRTLYSPALFLTKSGRADYWDDVDRFVRNQLTELQLTNTKWFYDLPENQGRLTYPDPEVETYIGPLVGNFAGWATLNDWHRPEFGPGIMTCCLGNCTRAMFYVWESSWFEFSDGVLKVHLLLNHASKWADIASYIPYEGRVTIRPKQVCRSLVVRIRELGGR